MDFFLLQRLVQLNFTPLCVILFLFMFLVINDSYEHALTLKFTPILILLCALILDDNLDYFFYDTADDGMRHIVTAVVGYNIRLLILYGLIIVVLRLSRLRDRLLMFVPVMIDVFVTCLSFFTHLVFWYEDGHVMRGYFAYIPHAIFAFYVMVLVTYGVRLLRASKREEAGIIFVESILAVIGTVVEMVFALRGILLSIVALDVTFYYLYLHTEHFKYDILTGAFNREKFYSDLRDFGESIFAVVSIDMNDLKVLNDTYGHAVGDRALQLVVKRLQKYLPSSCIVYRTGGDEFFALVLKSRKPLDIEDTFSRASNIIAQENIGIAWGYCLVDDDINKCMEVADSRMYDMKVSMKKVSGGVVR